MTAAPDELFDYLQMIGRGEISLRQVLNLDPGLIARLVDRALGQMGLGRHAEAEQLLADLTRVEPFAPTLPFLLGACCAEQRQFDKAVEAYTEALRRGGGDTALRLEVLLCRAQALLALGDGPAAIADLREVSADPNAPSAAQARALLGQIEAI